MIAYDFSTISRPLRRGFYELFSSAGKAHIASLLEQELEVAKNFTLTYETAELRKLDVKAKRGQATPEEQLKLSKANKVFKGQLANGYLIENEKAIKVINDYLDCMDIVEEDLNYLGGSGSADVSDNSEIILGKSLSFYNLHPDLLITDIYDSLFEAPKYTADQILRLAHLKAGFGSDKESTQVFKNRAEAEDFLIDVPGSPQEREILISKLADLQIVSDINAVDFQNRLRNIIKTLLKVDAEFNIEVYEIVKDVLPQYHNKKTKYFIYMLSQFNYSQSVPVSSRIKLMDLYAFYRKAEELCSY